MPMSTARSWAASLALLCSCTPATRRDPSPIEKTTVIEHVTVIPLDRDRRIEDASIVIRGERIASIIPSSAQTITADVRIDGRGLFAVPGFADMHVHPYDTEGFASYLAYGVTTIGVMNGSP